MSKKVKTCIFYMDLSFLEDKKRVERKYTM